MKRKRFLIALLGLFLFARFAQADWTPATRITWNSGYSDDPAIAADSMKNLHLVWDDDSPGDYEIYYKKSTDGGGTWSPAKRLAWDETWNNSPVAAVDSKGTIHLLWRKDYAYDEADIFYRKSTDGGATWSYAEDLTSGPVLNGRSYGPALAIDSTNTVHFVRYDEPYIDNFEIYYKKNT